MKGKDKWYVLDRQNARGWEMPRKWSAELWTKKGRYYILKYSDSCSVLLLVVLGRGGGGGALEARKNYNPITWEGSLKPVHLKWIGTPAAPCKGNRLARTVLSMPFCFVQSAQSSSAWIKHLTSIGWKWTGFIWPSWGTSSYEYYNFRLSEQLLAPQEALFHVVSWQI
jgi:hypothetical protein